MTNSESRIYIDVPQSLLAHVEAKPSSCDIVLMDSNGGGTILVHGSQFKLHFTTIRVLNVEKARLSK